MEVGPLVSQMPKGLDVQCSALMLAVDQVRKDLKPEAWASAARPPIDAHMRAAYRLAAHGQLARKGATTYPPGLHAQCDELLEALREIPLELDPLSWIGRARPIVEKHMSAAYHLGAFGDAPAPELPPRPSPFVDFVEATLRDVEAGLEVAAEQMKTKPHASPPPPARGKQGDLFGGA